MDIPTPSSRINRILKIFLVGLAIVLVRVWYLSVVCHDAYYEESRKPKQRCCIARVERGSIRDRFNIPLAVNKTQYNAAICYADIRQIPRIIRKWDEKGKKRRVMARKNHVEKLSLFLAEALEMDPQAIEDTIYGKACLFPHTPFVLKEDISEELFYKLKMQEKDWLGIHMQRSVKRTYPQGKLACDVLGYMGAISQREYLRIAKELEELSSYLSEHDKGEVVFLPEGFSSPQEVRDRLKELEEKSYTINDQVGKSGVEAAFDEELRGHFGKKWYEVDIKGNILSPLPGGREAIPGQRLILSLSSELQEEAEKLLAEYEHFQDMRDQASGKPRQVPWQRGGAIVVMHPKTGEILALASYPRFDPNDLVPSTTFSKRKQKRSSILQWLENEAYIGEIWDGKRPMQRERFINGEFVIEECPLTWEVYLNTTFPKKGPLYESIHAMDTIDKAIAVQKDLSYVETIPNKKDQQLLLDLAKTIVKKECFPSSLLHQVGDQTLSDFRLYCQALACHIDFVKEQARSCFHNGTFQKWREAHFKAHLKAKRRAEKARRTYARPYTEYLEKQEQVMFSQFWEENRWELLHTFVFEESQNSAIKRLRALLKPMQKQDRICYLQALRPFNELNRPLKGKYRSLRKEQGLHQEKHLAGGFYPYAGFGTARSQAFRQSSPMGSVFKLVPAYAALMQQYSRGEADLNPLTIMDDMQWTARPGSNSQVLGFLENGEPIKRLYKGGRLPRAYPNIGKIDLAKAIERTSNIYFSLLAGDVLDSPTTLLRAAMDFGLGRPTGVDLPGEYKGVLPNDILYNKTGLYAFAIGQHSLVATPLQTATLLSAIANGGKILKPQIAKLTASEEGSIDFRKPEVCSTLPLPKPVREELLKGMWLVTNGEKGSARPALIRSAFHNKEAVSAYKQLRSRMVGKTGTAEILHKRTIDADTKADLEKHVWFGSIAFEDETLTEPELVIVVYSRFGSAGKQGAPIAAKLIKKWEEIKSSHN